LSEWTVTLPESLVTRLGIDRSALDFFNFFGICWVFPETGAEHAEQEESNA
jgi:hypothetical protein